MRSWHRHHRFHTPVGRRTAGRRCGPGPRGGVVLFAAPLGPMSALEEAASPEASGAGVLATRWVIASWSCVLTASTLEEHRARLRIRWLLARWGCGAAFVAMVYPSRQGLVEYLGTERGRAGCRAANDRWATREWTPIVTTYDFARSVAGLRRRPGREPARRPNSSRGGPGVQPRRRSACLQRRRLRGARAGRDRDAPDVEQPHALDTARSR